MQIQCSGEDGGITVLHPAQTISLTLASKSTGADSVGPLPAQETLQLTNISSKTFTLASS